MILTNQQRKELDNKRSTLRRRGILALAWLLLGLICTILAAWLLRSEPILIILSLLVGQFVTIRIWRALFAWKDKARPDYIRYNVDLGTTSTVQLISYERASSGHTDRPEGYVSLTVRDANKSKIYTISPVRVPLSKRKCLLIGAKLVACIPAEEMNYPLALIEEHYQPINWEATERLQATDSSSSTYQTVHCSNCGAPLRPESTNQPTPCTYCGELNVPTTS